MQFQVGSIASSCETNYSSNYIIEKCNVQHDFSIESKAIQQLYILSSTINSTQYKWFIFLVSTI